LLTGAGDIQDEQFLRFFFLSLEKQQLYPDRVRRAWPAGLCTEEFFFSIGI